MAPPGPAFVEADWNDDESMDQEEARDDRDRVLGSRMVGPPAPVVDFPPQDEEEMSDRLLDEPDMQ